MKMHCHVRVLCCKNDKGVSSWFGLVGQIGICYVFQCCSKCRIGFSAKTLVNVLISYHVINVLATGVGYFLADSEHLNAI